MKVIVAHPGRQHSYRLASALKKNNILLYYVTTIYNKKNSILMKMLKVFLSNDNAKRIDGRKNIDLEDEEVIQYCRIGGIIEAFLARVDKTHRVYRFMQRYDAKRFGIKVAKLAIKQNADMVIMYDSNAKDCFEYLKKNAPNIKRVLDVSIAARPYMKSIYQKEIDVSGCNDLRKENQYMWNPKLLKPMEEEIINSQYFLAASKFVRESLEYCGIKRNQISIVPYGANVESNIIRKKITKSQKLELLFVGQVIYRKGISYLIECMPEFEEKANLTITGAYNANDWFVTAGNKMSNVVFTGQVTFDKMRKIYEKSDIFILPSFAEGMAQVGIEAMACGLPIICTVNSGVADLVEDGINGFIIEAGNKKQISEKIEWFIEHRERIPEMGNLARQTAKKYSWAQYEKNVVNAILAVSEKKECV